MSIIEFLEVLRSGSNCFSIGYTLGKDNNKTQK